MVAAIIISICSCVVCLKLCVWEISIAIVCLLLMHMFGFDSYCSITIAHRGECIIATIDCRLRFVCGEVEVWLFVWYAVSYDCSSRSTQTRVQIGFARLCACPTCTMRVRRDHRLCLYWCWWAVAIASPCIYVCVCVFFLNFPVIRNVSSWPKVACCVKSQNCLRKVKIKIVVAVFCRVTQKKPFQQEMLLFVCWCCSQTLYIDVCFTIRLFLSAWFHFFISKHKHNQYSRFKDC